MTAAVDLIEQARQHGVALVMEAGKVKVRAATPPPPELVASLRAHRADIAAALSQGEAVPLAAEHEREERAALAHFDGQAPREWAEGFAMLQTMPPPPGIPRARWWEIINDAGGFMDAWATKARALGWTTADVFGIDAKAPEHRHDLAGLVPLLEGRPVVAITEDSATIQLPKGKTTRVFRRHGPTGALLWELGD